MKTSFIALCAGSVLILSCANEKETATDKSSSDSVSQTSVPAQLPSDAINTSAPQTFTTQPATPQTSAPAAAGMNPAHGEPGHRCDIAVGAPLNSPPSSTPAAPVTSTPTATFNPPPAAPVTTTPTATAPGMNPPHGQPGHDCAVAVGAPLNK